MSMFKDRSKLTGNKICLLAGVVAMAAVVLTLGVAGCGDSGNPAGGGGGGDGGGDGSSGLVLGANEAWIECFDDEGYEECFGLVFREDGSVIQDLQKNSNGDWVGLLYRGKAWSTSGNRLIIKEYNICTGEKEEYRPWIYIYTISDNTLTIREAIQYTNTDVSGISIEERGGNMDSHAENRDRRLILPNNRAWVVEYIRYDENCTRQEYYQGYIFQTDGGFIEVGNRGYGWGGSVVGTWFTNGNNLITRWHNDYDDWDGWDDVTPYTVSGNNFTIELGEVFSGTRTNNVALTIYDDWDVFRCEVYGNCGDDDYYSQSKRPTRDHLRRSALHRPGIVGGIR